MSEGSVREEGGGWDNSDWATLLRSIDAKECTPFIGAGACHGVLKTGREIARELVDDNLDDYGVFPFRDPENLPKVAQWLAVEAASSRIPKQLVREKLLGRSPDFEDPGEPHRVLADLALPVYITTNYDSFMEDALRRSPDRTPHQVVCQWHRVNGRSRPSLSLGVTPSPQTPVIFHMHGVLDDRDSMVLTEDDYVDFLIAISEHHELIPPRIQDAFSSTAVLFMGYSLEDMDFKVVFRKVTAFLKINQGLRHVSVQLAPRATETMEEHKHRVMKQEKYLEKLLQLSNVKIYWGTCREFARNLRERLDEHNRRKQARNAGSIAISNLEARG